MRADRDQARRPEGEHPSVLRRLAVALALAAMTAAGAGGAAAAAPATVPAVAPVATTSTLPAGHPAVVLPAASTEAPEEEAPGEETDPVAPETDEGTTERSGPHPIVWFLAAAALLALALGFVVMTRGDRTRP